MALEQTYALRVRSAGEGDRTVAYGGRELARAEELPEYTSAYSAYVGTSIHLRPTRV